MYRYINADIKKQGRKHILIAAIAIISITALFIVFVPNRNRIQATRLLQGSWIEYSNSGYATTLEFNGFGGSFIVDNNFGRHMGRLIYHGYDGSFEAYVYTQYSQIRGGLFPNNSSLRYPME